MKITEGTIVNGSLIMLMKQYRDTKCHTVLAQRPNGGLYFVACMDEGGNMTAQSFHPRITPARSEYKHRK